MECEGMEMHRVFISVFLTVCLFVFFARITFGGNIQYVQLHFSNELINTSSTQQDYRLDTPILSNLNTNYSWLIKENQSYMTSVVDAADNRKGIFQVSLKPKEKVSFEHNYVFAVNDQITPEIVAKNVLLDYSYTDKEKKYLQPSPKIQSNEPLIIKRAKEIKKTLSKEFENNAYELTRATYNYVEETMHYVIDNPSFSNIGALYAENQHAGVCEDYAELMVALLRANGVPSRTVTGFMVYPEILKANIVIDLYGKEHFSYHMWVEAFIPGYGWNIFDPTMASSTIKNILLTNEKGDQQTVTVHPPLPKASEIRFGKTDNQFYIPQFYDAPYPTSFDTGSRIWGSSYEHHYTATIEFASVLPTYGQIEFLKSRKR
jgi:transglutaminase-like putative cysteine protease